jgi:3-keto-disaccharide hydrolase
MAMCYTWDKNGRKRPTNSAKPGFFRVEQAGGRHPFAASTVRRPVAKIRTLYSSQILWQPQIGIYSMRNFWSVTLSVVIIFIASTVYGESPKSKGKTTSPKPDAEGWYSLFNGKNLKGWKASEDNPDTFKVVDGEIVAHGKTCHLYYRGPVNHANFKNFEWKCEILTKPHSNSGMYFHTKYQPNEFPHTGIEVQINNTHRDPIKTGSLYRLKNIMNDSPAKDDEWFTQTVIVNGYHVIVKINDKVVNDYTQPEDLKREPGWEKNVIGSGTFALQGHDPGSETHFRKVMVKPLP